MKKRRNITIDEDVLQYAALKANEERLPLSRWIERLILKEKYVEEYKKTSSQED